MNSKRKIKEHHQKVASQKSVQDTSLLQTLICSYKKIVLIKYKCAFEILDTCQDIIEVDSFMLYIATNKI